MKRRPKTLFSVPAVRRKGRGVFFSMREACPLRLAADWLQVLAAYPSVEYAKELLWALVRHNSERGRGRNRWSYTNKCCEVGHGGQRN